MDSAFHGEEYDTVGGCCSVDRVFPQLSSVPSLDVFKEDALSPASTEEIVNSSLLLKLLSDDDGMVLVATVAAWGVPVDGFAGDR